MTGGQLGKKRTWDRSFLDLRRSIFGALLVLERAPDGPGVHWLCECVCGKKTTVAARNLSTGNTKSCGCHAHRPLPTAPAKVAKLPIDLTDRVFYNWTALKRGERPGHWLCRCLCGTEREVRMGSLRSHASKSCGCRPRTIRQSDGWCGD
jgi:hypothetical protein